MFAKLTSSCPVQGLNLLFQLSDIIEQRYFCRPTHRRLQQTGCESLSPFEAVSTHLKHSSEKWKSIWWFEDYNETLLFLYDLFFAKQQASQK
jgi:hypothetical protein